MSHIGNATQFNPNNYSTRPSVNFTNFWVGVTGSYGPTAGVGGTGFYSGIGAEYDSKYVLYQSKSVGGPSIRTFSDTGSLVKLLRREQTITSVAAGREFPMAMQTASLTDDICILNKDLEDIHPGDLAIVGNRPLYLYFDAGFFPNYVSSSEYVYFGGTNAVNLPPYSGSMFPRNDSSEYKRYSPDSGSYITIGAGEQSYIDTNIKGDSTFRSPLTMDFWIYLSGSQGADTRLFSLDQSGSPNGLEILVNGTKVKVTVADNTTEFTTPTLSPNTWNHLTVICDSTSDSISINASTLTTTNRFGIPPTNINEVTSPKRVFFGSQAGAGSFFTGGIGAFSLYSGVLTQTEIQRNFDAKKARFGK